MDTKQFRTRQEMFERNNPKGNSFIIGLDAGYSGMKVFTEDKYFCFPSYVKRLKGNMLNMTSEKDILYRDAETKEVYMIGTVAQDMVSSTDTNDFDGELVTRKRYKQKAFKVLLHTAIGMAIMNKTDARDLFIQTGLPSSYVKADKGALTQVLCAPAKFALKIGMNDWQQFEYKISEQNVDIMPQPAGSLYSVMIQDDGSYVENAADYLFGNTLVTDSGYGTLDLHGIMNRALKVAESSDELGMNQVLDLTRDKIMDEMHEDVRAAMMQKNLEKGSVTVFDEDEMQSDEKPFDDLLQQSSVEVFNKCFEKVKNTTNSFRDYNYLIIAGGTGEAWYDMFKAKLAGMKSLTVMPSNINDGLPFIYSNVRGYYLYRYVSEAQSAKGV